MFYLDNFEFKPYLESEKGPKNERKSHFDALKNFYGFYTSFLKWIDFDLDTLPFQSILIVSSKTPIYIK